MAEPALTVDVLDGGSIDIDDMSVYRPAAGPVRGTLANDCFLVRHPAGILLWDCGLPDELANEPDGRRVFGHSLLRVRRTVAEQLTQLAVDPGQIDYLGLSHLHLDHVGNAGLAPAATLVAQRAEYNAAFDDNPELCSYDPTAYAHLLDRQWLLLDGEHDLFGDGRVIFLPAPGHTPGHQVLFLALEGTGPVILSGDLAHVAANWRDLSTPVYNADRETSVASMRHVRELARGAGRATVVAARPGPKCTTTGALLVARSRPTPRHALDVIRGEC